MEYLMFGAKALGLLLLSLAAYRHLVITLTIIYVNMQTDKKLLEEGRIDQMRSPNFYTAFAFATLFNLVQTSRFDKQVVQSDYFIIDFRGSKPRYTIK